MRDEELPLSVANPRKYALEYCEKLLSLNPRGCDRLYWKVRNETMEKNELANTDAVRAALIDGPKTCGAILTWCRAQGNTWLDLPICNMILPRLQTAGEVAWDGRTWSATEKIVEPSKPTIPAPAPESSPEVERDHFSRIAAMKVGDAIFLKPSNGDVVRLQNNLRTALYVRKDTRDFKWSLLRVQNEIKVSKHLRKPDDFEQIVQANVSPVHKPSQVQPCPTGVDRHVAALMAHINAKIAELEALKIQLAKVYGEQTCP